MRLLKISIYILIALSAVVFVGPVAKRILFPSKTQKEFRQLVQAAADTKSNLDLRNLQTIDWDGIAMVLPYDTTARFDFPYFGPVIDSRDDGEAYLLFLKGSALVEYFELPRSPLDFALCKRLVCEKQIGSEANRYTSTKCSCTKRINREQAIFVIEQSPDRLIPNLESE
jgi:hypothetical protein